MKKYKNFFILTDEAIKWNSKNKSTLNSKVEVENYRSKYEANRMIY